MEIGLVISMVECMLVFSVHVSDIHLICPFTLQ